MDKDKMNNISIEKKISNNYYSNYSSSSYQNNNYKRTIQLAQFQEDENSSVSTFSSCYNTSSGIYTPRKVVGVAKLSEGIISYSEFKLSDTHPQRQRETLIQLQKQTDKLIKEEKIKTLPKDAQRGKKEYSLKPRSRAMNRINAFLSKKKCRRSRQENFHLLYLAVCDRRSSQAISIIEELSSNTLRKKKYNEANKIFLLALINGLENVVIAMMEKGFPPNVNAPIFDVSMSSEIKIILPSFFILSVALGLENVVKIMIKKAYINQTWNGLTALHIACCKGDEKLVSMIIDYGADLFQPLPLEQYYTLGKLKSMEAQIITHKYGVLNDTYIDTQLGNKKTYDDVPENVIKSNCLYPIDLVAASGNLKITGLLINRIGISGIRRSKLCLVLQQQYNMSMFLMKYGASYQQTDIWGNSPLHIASRQGNLKLVIVYSNLLNVNLQGENKWTPLHEALSRNHRDVCQYLLKKGASTEIRNINNLTPRELAKQRGILDVDIDSCLDQTTEYLVEGEISEKDILTKINRYMSNLSLINSSRLKQSKKRNQFIDKFPKVFQKERTFINK